MGELALKVVHVDINGWVYGVQKYVINFCKELNRIGGYRSIVVWPSGEYLNALRTENIPVVPIQDHWKKIDTDPAGWLRLYHVVKREEPRIIHSHGTKENIISRIIGRLLGIPVVPVYHCNHRQFGRRDNGIRFKRRIYEAIYLDVLERLTSYFSVENIAVSHSVRNNIRKFGIPDRKIRVIYSGINVDDFGVEEPTPAEKTDKVRIVSVSRIDESKGIIDIINAAKMIKEKGCSFEINFVGDGPLLKECRHLVNKYRLDTEITFLGYMKNVKEILLSSDVFVSASYSEGLPINIVEALSCGLPVVVTGAGGIKEIVDHQVNGLIVDTDAPEQLKEALLLMIGDSNLREKYGRRGRQKVLERFGIHRMISDYMNLYNAINERRTN